MTTRLLDRLLHFLFVLWAVATLTFFTFRLMPGDPTLNFISPVFSEDMRQTLLHSFGLDRSLPQQYLLYFSHLLRFDLGQSFLQDRPVTAILGDALPNSIVLTLVAMLIAYGFGILAGAALAFRRGTTLEAAAIPTVLATRAAPEFWLGMLLLALFAFQLGWFPTDGAVSPGNPATGFLQRVVTADYWWHLVLPAATLALFLQGLPLLLMRATMLDVLGEEFITMARMKGLSRWAIVIRHAARNALLPVVTAFALSLGATIGGNVVIETVFAWPGIGRVLVQAVQGADYPLAEGAFLVIAATLVLMNTLADLAYGILDPRVSVGARR